MKCLIFRLQLALITNNTVLMCTFRGGKFLPPPAPPTQGTVGFVKFDIKDINSKACDDPEKGIRQVAQVAMMGCREVLIAGGYVNKVNLQRFEIACRLVGTYIGGKCVAHSCRIPAGS